MPVFRDRFFTEVTELIMKSLAWALTHYDWCPYKKRRLRHRHELAQRKVSH